MTIKQIVAVVLAIAAVVSLAIPGVEQPTPRPDNPGGLSLAGMFVGETAAADASSLSSLCEELAECIKHDGTLEPPRLKTGVQMDDLRVAAREARMRGQSIGARQPAVRDAIKEYLDSTVGTNGGPVGQAERDAWVSAYKSIARAAADAIE
jgi:hypothetical protein